MPSSDTTLHKAIVHNVSDAGVYVKIPSLLGSSESIALYKPRLTNDSWPPSVGDQLLVAVEGGNFNRVYVVSNIDNQYTNYLTEIADGSITTLKLANNAVTYDKLADGSVSADKIASNAVGSDEIAAGAVGQSELASDAVTTAKILNSNVTSSKIADGAVTDSKLNLSRVQATGVLTLGGSDSAAVTFDTKVFETAIIPFIDVPGDFFVPPIEGLYAISATIVSSSAGTNQSARLNINFINANQITFPPSTTLVFSHIAWLTPYDPVQLVIVNSTSISRIYNCTFTMVRISG